MQPVAPPSPDYIPDPKEQQTPPVPQDEDEREPMFIQAHDPDYVLEPVYPEYIPLEDEHVFPVEEQPLPLVDSPIAESPGYVAESDPEEYKDDETKDGLVDYLMDGGDDGDDDDDDCDSSRDDADDEDEEDDEEEDEEHLAPADSAIVVPTVEPVSLLEGTKLVIPPPSTNISTTGARITVWLQASISLPPEAKTTVDAEARWQGICEVGYGIRDTWVDPAEAVPKIAPMTVGEVNTRVTDLAKLHERNTQDLYALLDDAQDGRTRISQRVAMDSHWVDLLLGDRMTLQEIVYVMEEEAYASRGAWAHSIGLSQATHQELQTHRDHVYALETHIQAQLQLQSTLIQTQHQITNRKQTPPLIPFETTNTTKIVIRVHKRIHELRLGVYKALKLWLVTLSDIQHSVATQIWGCYINSEARGNPQLSSGMSAFNLNEPIYSTSFTIHSESTSGNDALAISIDEADLGIFAPSDFIPQQQGMKEPTTIHMITYVQFGAIKLEDLAKLVPNVKVDFKDLDSPEDDPIIMVNDSEEDEEDKNEEIHSTTNDKTEDISASTPPSLRSIQLQELKNQVILLQSQKHTLETEKRKDEAEITRLKAQPSFPNDHSSKFDELTKEVKGLKKQVHELEIELPGDLKEIPSKLEEFTKTITSLTSQVIELKTLQWELLEEFVSLHVQVASVQVKLQTLDALPGLLLNVTPALNKFAYVLDSVSSKDRDQSVPLVGQANTMPAEGENNINQATIS
ncbi:hypothetical protein Tco_0906463 [Tanacetum coccineum]|uniref:Uncharacterized protein n=1 Tax=Tanacetum coccineum TaxID=301880 RepID=A0ABQ5CJS2_9ASTR